MGINILILYLGLFVRLRLMLTNVLLFLFLVRSSFVPGLSAKRCACSPLFPETTWFAVNDDNSGSDGIDKV